MGKVIVYQIFTRLFGNRNTSRIKDGGIYANGCGKFEDIDIKTLRRIHSLGATHVWYTGVIRHATCTDYSAHGIPCQHPSVVKGRAGSPYAITDYYDVDPDLAVTVESRMEEWESLVERTHSVGMKVVMDFVPNHVAREYLSIAKPDGVKDLGEDDDRTKHFSASNNFYYCVGEKFRSPAGDGYEEMPAKATGNDCFTSSPGINDWYETVKLNYGIDYNDWSGQASDHFMPVPDTWVKMTDIMLFWAAKGIDAFRCDMAEMVPAAFWAYASAKLRATFPEVKLIGEIYNPQQYRNYITAGFDFLYDKVGMYDTLRAVIKGQLRAAAITGQWQQVNDIRSKMLYFLENHDEQRIASDFFAGDPRRAVPALIVEALLSDNPIMLYAGQEFGEKGMDEEGFSGTDGRTTIFDYWCVDTIRRGYYDRSTLTEEEKHLEQTYSKILNVACRDANISDAPSYDLMYVNPQLAQKQFAFMRGNNMLVVANFRNRDVETVVYIPKHAFEFLHMKEGTVTAIDLLEGDSCTLKLKKDDSVSVRIKANWGIILKW